MCAGDRCSVACTERPCTPAYLSDEPIQATRPAVAQGSSEDTASARGATDITRFVATTKGLEKTTDYPFLHSDTGDFANTTTLPSGTKGELNLDVWRWPVGFLVDDLRIKRDFPHKPSVSRTVYGGARTYRQLTLDTATHRLGPPSSL